VHTLIVSCAYTSCVVVGVMRSCDEELLVLSTTTLVIHTTSHVIPSPLLVVPWACLFLHVVVLPRCPTAGGGLGVESGSLSSCFRGIDYSVGTVVASTSARKSHRDGTGAVRFARKRALRLQHSKKLRWWVLGEGVVPLCGDGCSALYVKFSRSGQLR
jgi:hypothetical protein